jgi:hypothetical protein
MAAGGTFSGWGIVWTCRSCRSAHYTMQNPTIAPARPRWGRFFCLANLFSSEYPWIQPRLFQFARRLRKAASGRAWSVVGEIDSLAALHCQRGYAVLSLIVRMTDLPTLMFPENAPRPVPTTSPTALRSSVAGRQSGCGRWRGSPARRTGTEQRCWRRVTT